MTGVRLTVIVRTLHPPQYTRVHACIETLHSRPALTWWGCLDLGNRYEKRLWVMPLLPYLVQDPSQLCQHLVTYCADPDCDQQTQLPGWTSWSQWESWLVLVTVRDLVWSPCSIEGELHLLGAGALPALALPCPVLGLPLSLLPLQSSPACCFLKNCDFETHLPLLREICLAAW